MALYFLPHRSNREILAPTRPRVIKWYCPFARQKEFPTGHRYCINVYTGCAHKCIYCYAATYEPGQVAAKRDFEKMIDRDIGDLDRFNVPAAPVHLSNSTDPFQPLEERTGHTRYALEQVLAHRDRFSTVTILTKNPQLPVERDYVNLFKALASLPASHPRADQFRRAGLPGLVLEVSLAFWRDEARAYYDPCAPSVASRVEAMRALKEAGIPPVIRIDPLFPRFPAGSNTSKGNLGLPEPQTLDDIEHLVGLASELRARHVVYSPAKICKPRAGRLSGPMEIVRTVYEALAAPHRLDFHGGSWRLPGPVAKARVVEPFLRVCERHGVRAKHCKQTLIETP